MKKYFSIFFAVALWITAAEASATNATWQLDNAHSEIGFSVRHLGISNVKGRFTTFSAQIKADKHHGKLVAVTANAKADSINTGIEARDNHLRGADFFDVARFKDLTMTSRSIEVKGNEVTMVADFTMKGITQTVTFKGEYLGSNKVDLGSGPTQRAGYSFTGKISRKAFGLTWNKLIEGISAVGDEVTIHFDVEIFRELK